MSILLKTPVGELAASNQYVARMFDAAGLDYVCHGSLTLEEACARAGIDPNVIRDALGRLPKQRQINWSDCPLRAVLIHLRDDSHPLLATEVERVRILVQRARCEEHRRELEELRELFAALSAEIESHAQKEEAFVFPSIATLDDMWARHSGGRSIHADVLHRAIRSAVAEHAVISDGIERIRRITQRIATHSGACAAIAIVLQELNAELREQIHLENNVLFPSAEVLNDVLRSASH